MPPGTVVKRKRGGALLGDLTNPGKPGLRNDPLAPDSPEKSNAWQQNCHRAAWGVPRCRLLTGCLQCLAKLLNKQEDMVWAGDLTPELLSSLLCWR